MFEKYYKNDELNIESIIIKQVIDEFYDLYLQDKLTESQQIEYLNFINTLIKTKHKYIVNFNIEKRHYCRNTEKIHLQKIKKMALLKLKLKSNTKPYRKRVEPKEISEEASKFKSLLLTLNKKIKSDIDAKTKSLLADLMREKWTVEEKIALLKSALNNKQITFKDILETKDNEELITSFLALLDMKRHNKIEVIQERNFGEIVIKRKE